MAFGTNHSIFSCFLIRLIPGPPIELTNLFIGTTGVKYTHFIIGTLLGYTPGMLLMVFMGQAMPEFFSSRFSKPLLVVFLLLITFLLAGGYLWRKRRKRGLPE